MTGGDNPAPDYEIFEAILRLEDAGAEPSLDALRAEFPDRESEVGAVLAAYSSYGSLLEEARCELLGDESPDHLPPGTQLGDYVIEGILGRGGMGVVYRAWPLSAPDTRVALKVLPPAVVARDARSVERFRREAELATRVRHRNLAEVYSSGADGELLFFAMRLIEGRPLGDVLRDLAQHRREDAANHQRPAYIESVVALVRQVAEGLQELHGRGLVHRDVKPSNIVLERQDEHDGLSLDGRPVLVDYGLLRPVESGDVTGSRTLLGTPAFVSPEGRLGQEVDTRSDVFSLGAVLHDLLALTPPGDRKLASAGLVNVRALNSGVDRRLGAIVEMALEHEPKLRYADAGEFGEDLSRYLDGRRVRALPLDPLRRSWRRVRRNPVSAVAFGSGVAIIVILAIALVFSQGVRAARLGAAAELGAQLEERGDLPGAWKAYQPLYEVSTRARLLPWLRADVDHARALHQPGPTSTVCALLQGSEGPPATWHSDLQEHLLTPGPNELEILRFLASEIAPEQTLARRAAAVETLAYYLLIHPRSLDEVLIDTATDEALATDLLEAARNGPQTDEYLLRYFSISALSGMTRLSVFEELLPLLWDEDSEVWELAKAATSRHWWQLQEDGELGQLDTALVQAWAQALAKGLAGRRSTGDGWSTTRGLMFSMAWSHAVARESDEQGPRGGPWPLVPELFRERLIRCERLLTRSALPESRGESLRVQGLLRELDARVSPYDHDNLWSLASRTRTRTVRNPTEPGPTAVTGELSFAVPDPGTPRFEKLVTKAAWVSCKPAVGALQFSSHHGSRLTVNCEIPKGATGARVTLLHGAAKRGMLPYRGVATVSMGLRDAPEFVVRELPLLGAERFSFELTEPELVRALETSGHLELTFELVSGNTTYWVHDLQVTFLYPLGERFLYWLFFVGEALQAGAGTTGSVPPDSDG